LATVPATVAEPFDATVIVYAPAVTTQDGENVGVISEMQVSVSTGDGSIFVETWPLSEIDTQASSRLAVAVAKKVTGIDTREYNFYYSIISNAPVIGGPSAGAILTVATIACINGWDVYPDVMMTGMINPDGTVGPVGGIYEKAKAASEFGITLFLVPQGQATVTVGEAQIDLTEYAPSEWGMEVREVLDITEAVTAFTGYEFVTDAYSGDIAVDTSFFKSDVEAELLSTKAFQVSLAADLFDAMLEEDVAEELTAQMISANERLSDAEEAIGQGRYYTAMSYLFQSRISYTYIDFALRYFEGEDPQQALDAIVGDVEREIGAVTSDVMALSQDIYGYAMLDAFSAAQERAFEAQEHLEQAKLYRVWVEPSNAIYAAALASERSRTSTFWLEIAKRYEQGDRIAIDDLQYDANTLIEDANLIYIYVSRMIGSSELLGDASELLAMAQEEYARGDYAAALYNAIESRTLSSVAIELYSCGEEAMARMELARVQAAKAIQRQASNGITPLLSMSYFEFADAFSGEEDCVQATLYYKYAAGVANAFTYLSSGDSSSPTFSFGGRAGGTSWTTAAAYLAAGFFCGALAVFAASKRQRKVFKGEIE
jgi:uncharacterized protein